MIKPILMYAAETMIMPKKCEEKRRRIERRMGIRYKWGWDTCEGENEHDCMFTTQMSTRR